MSKYGYSDIGDRKENEDAFGIYIYGKNLITVVADGLGGQGDGKKASELAVRQLSKCGSNGGFPESDEVSAAFSAANKALLERQLNQFHMKTTAVYLCIQEDYAIWAHIGDSRLYHFFDGKLSHYTLDHSISQVAVALGEIERKDIPKHPQKSRLLRALGSEDEEAVVHDKVRLEKGKHAFLLCTDGFWEYLDDSEISDLLAEAESAKMWILKMYELIESRCGSGNDNCTAAAVMLEV